VIRKEGALVRLRSLLVVVFVSLAASVAVASASAATICTGDVCVVTGGYAGLQADIAASGAPAPVVRLLTSEVALSQALHPPGPCVVSCVPSLRYLPSEYLLVLVDYQVGALSGLLPHAGCPGGCSFPGCPGGCTFPPNAARVVDGDIRAIFGDLTMFPPGSPILPTFAPSTTT
jgi:hypothetical protein